MAKSIFWRVGQQDDFYELFALVYSAKDNLKWSTDDIRRRLIIPLFLDQLIVFFDDDEVVLGFLTVAFMNDFSAAHMPNIGILPNDWRSGEQCWVVDLVAPHGDGNRMLFRITTDLKGTAWENVKYFRGKYKQLREVTI